MMITKVNLPLQLLTVALLLLVGTVRPFIPLIQRQHFASSASIKQIVPSRLSTTSTGHGQTYHHHHSTLGIVLNADKNGDIEDGDLVAVLSLSTSDQTVVGATGIVMSLVMLWSEFVLKSTGCGLPAGPFGLIGAVEGLSYLGVTGLVSFSVYTKVKTGKGLPAGNYGILGAAEGLAFLAVLAGLVVLILQVTNYGYIPNAVPMEGGMCQ